MGGLLLYGLTLADGCRVAGFLTFLRTLLSAVSTLRTGPRGWFSSPVRTWWRPRMRDISCDPRRSNRTSTCGELPKTLSTGGGPGRPHKRLSETVAAGPGVRIGPLTPELPTVAPAQTRPAASSPASSLTRVLPSSHPRCCRVGPDSALIVAGSASSLRARAHRDSRASLPAAPACSQTAGLRT